MRVLVPVDGVLGESKGSQCAGAVQAGLSGSSSESKRERFKCQLLNFILGEAKLAVYTSRRNRVAQTSDDDVVWTFSRLVRSRILIDFNYYKSSHLFAGSTASPSSVYESLTRRHGVKVVCRVSVEECCLAAGNAVGHSNIVSASCMNSAVVLFLKTVDLANGLVQSGVVIDGQLTLVSPLSAPSKKVILSNVPPFIKDKLIARELSRHGKLVSPIRKVPLGCKNPLIKHLVSFRRAVFMVLKDGEDLDLVMKFSVDGFEYAVFVTSETASK
ncbi:hypothetical protein MHYP_G00147610 [Metynnis hypsauchen]